MTSTAAEERSKRNTSRCRRRSRICWRLWASSRPSATVRKMEIPPVTVPGIREREETEPSRRETEYPHREQTETVRAIQEQAEAAQVIQEQAGTARASREQAGTEQRFREEISPISYRESAARRLFRTGQYRPGEAGPASAHSGSPGLPACTAGPVRLHHGQDQRRAGTDFRKPPDHYG